MPFRGAAVRVMARLQCGVNRREELNQLQPADKAAYADVDHYTHLSRGFYVAGGLLAAAGAGLYAWDLHLRGTTITGQF